MNVRERPHAERLPLLRFALPHQAIDGFEPATGSGHRTIDALESLIFGPTMQLARHASSCVP